MRAKGKAVKAVHAATALKAKGERLLIVGGSFANDRSG